MLLLLECWTATTVLPLIRGSAVTIVAVVNVCKTLQSPVKTSTPLLVLDSGVQTSALQKVAAVRVSVETRQTLSVLCDADFLVVSNTMELFSNI